MKLERKDPGISYDGTARTRGGTTRSLCVECLLLRGGTLSLRRAPDGVLRKLLFSVQATEANG